MNPIEILYWARRGIEKAISDFETAEERLRAKGVDLASVCHDNAETLRGRLATLETLETLLCKERG